MEINKKLKIFSVTIAILAIILSVITTVYKPEIRSQGKTPEEITIELEEQQKLDTVMADIRKTLQVNDICDSYIKLCSDTLDVNDAIKAKKAELLSEAQNLKTKAKEFGSEAEGIYNSPALSVANREEQLIQNSKYQAIKQSKNKCEKLKSELETLVKQYNEEQEKIKQTAAEAEKNKKANEESKQTKSNSESQSSSSSSSKSSRSSSSSGSSYSNNYSSSGSNSYSGRSSSYSDDSYSNSNSSYSEASSSSESSGGGYTGADLGSER